ncbi:DNA/RNA nuclease SfsA [Shumkonia mesophila]|uniref:DNA/RNA nuclease SfsA n=1 Tax=Shumkonia mesophila TaxID=2838854 RepID=UPI0029343266|nr:DNA/RNA nuclease SfsA [Shumkonia mesophila]
MKFTDPLLKGTLVRRYKRFLADVLLDSGEAIVAHCANSGSMLSVNTPGAEVWVSPARNPERKLRYTWEMIRIGDGLVGINTQHPNLLAAEAVAANLLPELAGYTVVRREVKYGRNSRIDLLLEADGRPPCYVEVKNVTMRRDLTAAGAAEFPDAVTVRGAKHLDELAAMKAQGYRAVMLFLAQRDDCRRFAVAGDIDPLYAAGLAKARAAGVETLCYGCRLSPFEITIDRPIPLEF